MIAGFAGLLAAALTFGADHPAGASIAAAVATPEVREFGEWRAACDNGGRCFAYTGSDTGAWLIIRRDAGPGGRPEILAGFGPAFDETSPDDIALLIDGREQRLESSGEAGAARVPAADTLSALVSIAASRGMSLSLMDEGPALPTSGATAALVWIDEQQGRLGSTTALIRRGDRAPSTVPAAPARPAVRPARPVDQGPLARAADPMNGEEAMAIRLPEALEALATVKACRADTADNAYLQKAVLAARLGDDVQLWGVPCFSGAYNAGYDLYLTDGQGRSPRLAVFPDSQGRPPESDEFGGDGLVNPAYDARTNTISHFPRARGIGDCGTRQTWAWTGGAFALVEEKTMGDCWGISSDLWPTLWRTR